MVVAIAGGALQGLEMTYLARKAGFETLLLDRRGDAPATGICDAFAPIDLTDHGALTEALGSVEMVLPATENPRALRSLVEWCRLKGVPLAFDPVAYATTSSKGASNALFQRLGIPTPTHWPECTFPVLAKPDGESGGRGVEVFSDPGALECRFGPTLPSDLVFQEYLTGPAFSIEVMGRPGEYTPLQVTALEMDEDYDCMRVMAPSPLPAHLTTLFEGVAVKVARAVELTGIMDVEAILHEGELKVLEIDARFPSQTPIAVYHSTGINMVERLVGLFRNRGSQDLPSDPPPARGSVLEHVGVREGRLFTCGEHVMAESGPLHHESSFFGPAEALTSYTPGSEEWVATLMIQGEDLGAALTRRDRVIQEIRESLGLGLEGEEAPRELSGGGS